MNSQELVARVSRIETNMWKDFNKIVDDFKFQVDRIVLPWFEKWIQWDDEHSVYTVQTARKTFWKKIPTIDQFVALEEYLEEKWNVVDLEDVFHRIVWMNSPDSLPYFVETWESILSNLWFKWAWFAAITSTPFWPYLAKLWLKWTIKNLWWCTHITNSTRTMEKWNFKLRLLAE